MTDHMRTPNVSSAPPLDDKSRMPSFIPMDAPPPYNSQATSFAAPAQSHQHTADSQPQLQQHPQQAQQYQQQPLMQHQQPQPMYQPHPMMYQPPQQMMHSNTVVVTQSSSNGRTVMVEKRAPMQHWLHCLISLLFPPWLCVWIILCIMHSNKKDKTTVI